MSLMGVKIDQLDVPVCNSFRPKIIKDQSCYTVDPNEYKDKIDLRGELSLSLSIHHNGDRQLEDVEKSSDDHFITIDTIGKITFALDSVDMIFTEPLKLHLKKKYYLDVSKKLL